MLWVRRDLMEQAGLDKAIPETWDDLRAMPFQGNADGRASIGAPLPYGLQFDDIADLHRLHPPSWWPGLSHRIWKSIFDSDAHAQCSRILPRNACITVPPGATNYSWGESLTAFVSGATATGIYTGRALINVNDAKPANRGLRDLRHLSAGCRRISRLGRSTTSRR